MRARLGEDYRFSPMVKQILPGCPLGFQDNSGQHSQNVFNTIHFRRTLRGNASSKDGSVRLAALAAIMTSYPPLFHHRDISYINPSSFYSARLQIRVSLFLPLPPFHSFRQALQGLASWVRWYRRIYAPPHPSRACPPSLPGTLGWGHICFHPSCPHSKAHVP